MKQVAFQARPQTLTLKPQASSLILLAVLCLFLVGCSQGPATTTQQQMVEGLTFALEQPQDALLLKSYDLVLTLTDAAGSPVEDAQVFLDLTMPAMPMGQNQPIAEPLGGGRYRAQAVYNMEGDWRITVNATVGGKRYSAGFEQSVRTE
ncbi:MAG: FixH family protein [Roseiflexaceae bacterium]